MHMCVVCLVSVLCVCIHACGYAHVCTCLVCVCVVSVYIVCVPCVYLCTCVCAVCEWRGGVEGLLMVQKQTFGETESGFLRDKIILIHLGGLIITSGSGFICRTNCHLSD